MDKRISLIILTAIILALAVDALVDYVQLNIQKASLQKKPLAAVAAYKSETRESTSTITSTATTVAPSLSLREEGLKEPERRRFGESLKEFYNRVELLVADIAIALAIALAVLLVFRQVKLKRINLSPLRIHGRLG